MNLNSGGNNVQSNIQITPKSTLKEAFLDFTKKHALAPNTLKAYGKNVDDKSAFMLSKGFEPILENVSYELCDEWVSELQETFSPKTIQQKQATIVSIFSHYNKMGVLSGNPFSALKINVYNDVRHSETLNINEFFQMYKAAIELEQDGIPVQIPIHLSMFSALRNKSLGKLKVSSMSIDNGGLMFTFKNKKVIESDSKFSTNMNSRKPKHKNKHHFLPLPSKLLYSIQRYIEGNDLDDSLLYGLRGKPLDNKQLNYIVNKVCEHMGWAKKHKDENGNLKLERLGKTFTPHGFRYTLPTLFDEMGVSNESLRYLLGHSKFHLGNLQYYVLSDLKHIKELSAAQMILETLLETALDLENYNIKLDLNVIFEDLTKVLENQKKNKRYVELFKESIIHYAMQKQQYEMTNPGSNGTNLFTYVAPELSNQLFTQQMNGMSPQPYGNPFVNAIPQNNLNPAQGLYQQQQALQYSHQYGNGSQGYQTYQQQYGMPIQPHNLK